MSASIIQSALDDTLSAWDIHKVDIIKIEIIHSKDPLILNGSKIDSEYRESNVRIINIIQNKSKDDTNKPSKTSILTIKDFNVPELIINIDNIYGWNVNIDNCNLRGLQIKNSSLGSLSINNSNIKSSKNVEIFNYNLEKIEKKLDALFVHISSVFGVYLLKVKSIGITIGTSCIQSLVIKESELNIRKDGTNDCLNLSESTFYYIKLYKITSAETKVKKCRIVFSDCEINSGVHITKIEADIFIDGHKDIKTLILNRNDLGELSIIGLSIVNFELGNSEIEQTTEINKLTLKNVNISFLRISNIWIKNFDLVGEIKSDSRWYFERLQFKTLSITKLVNEGSIRFFGCSFPEVVNTYLSVKNSDFGICIFMECNFFVNIFFFQASSIVDSSMINSKIIYSKFKENGSSQHFDDIGILQLELYFTAQLRRIYERQLDHRETLDKLAKVQQLMLTERKIELKNQLRTKLSSDFWGKAADFVILLTNKYSNSFGTNWVRALLILLSVNIIIYSFYCYSVGYHLECNPSSDGINTLFANSSRFFLFVLPFRGSNPVLDVSQHGSSNFAPLLDAAGRIFSSYAIYQLVQAFRIYGKH